MSLSECAKRTILSDIPCVVFRTAPYEKSMTTIHENTSRLTNEILKQRISCIPIHIKDMSFDINNLIVELNVKNDTDTTLYVTTKDFKIKDIKTDRYLPQETVREYFPPDPLTNDYIIITRLRPKISETIPGEVIKLESKMTISRSQDSCFYVT